MTHRLVAVSVQQLKREFNYLIRRLKSKHYDTS